MQAYGVSIGRIFNEKPSVSQTFPFMETSEQAHEEYFDLIIFLT